MSLDGLIRTSSGRLYSWLLSARYLVRHGLYWLAAGIASDTVTALIMMGIDGPAAEGNLVLRKLFTDPTIPNLTSAVLQQYIWVILILWGISLILMTRRPDRPRAWPMWMRASVFALTLGVLVIWSYASIRIYFGTLSNVAGMLYSYGKLSATAGRLLGAVAFLAPMIFDLRRGLEIRHAG